MPRFLNRLGLAFILLLSGNAWALGLGEIKLNSALNEPLRAEIGLLSATPEELADLRISLASAETFTRYKLDRPGYLQNIQFEIVKTPQGRGSYVLVSSRQPMTEPFLTFLVEASWARGRLLREYTVLLDPPTYAPPQAVQQAVSAPQRATPSDSGRIERPAPAEPAPRPAPRAAPAPRPAPQSAEPAPASPSPATPYSGDSGEDYLVSRSQTLWGIARSVRPDSRLSINQTMLAIYEANPEAFGGNINILKAGARLRIPSADEIYRIDRRAALEEVQRQHQSWDGTPAPAPGSYQPPVQAAPEPVEPEVEAPEPSLTLVPPDEEPAGVADGSDASLGDEPMTREQAILDRLEQIEASEIPEQQSLIDLRNDELANLREELRQIRGETAEPLPDDIAEDPFVDDSVDDIMVDDAAEEPVADDAADDVAAEAKPAPPPVRRVKQPTLLETVTDFLLSFWMIIVGALIAVAGILFWFLQRRGEDGEASAVWQRLDDDDDLMSLGRTSQTETMPAPDGGDDAFVVVEQDKGGDTIGDTLEMPFQGGPGADATAETEVNFDRLEDTFSSETAVNLDQSDPIAEADFHMAYGLYDQAADLINGALEVEPERQDLLTKLCEIYFVWGNRDSFVDAAERVKQVIGSSESAEWDKIVIMGQQIAADHSLFEGAGVAGATKEVDLTFDAGSDDGGDLDMVFGDDSGDDDDLDFMFDGDTSSADVDENLEATVETPTIDHSFDEKTAEVPATDATAEIDLDDLGLDLDALDGDDDMDITGSHGALEDTGINEALLPDLDAETGKNPAVDPNATGLTGAFDMTDLAADLEATGERKTIEAPLDDDPDFDILAATGKTQVLSDDMAVQTMNEPGGVIDDNAETLLASNFGDEDDTSVGTGTEVIAEDDATMLAPGPEGDFDFAKTEALPKDAFDTEATAETPALASTDMDLDLDDLTAVLEASDVGGDTVEMPRDDETVEQPRPSVDDATAEVPTMRIGGDELSDDLSEARTMTEVGTKLDLARAYVDMGDPGGARSILEEVLDEGDNEQRQQAQQLLDSLPG